MNPDHEQEALPVEFFDTCEQPFCASRDDFAPAFNAPALINNEISSVDLLKERGKWVILFFYASDFTFV
ncbi:alkyl hydroperoxide reductase [Salipaludibacillus keqinensis]|uniref:Alkyl hydroperoxide reductase n=2 Tax=Salipaludibacillus keqinensis TaxID=2045207 RepID=A0A323TDI8_9BACI|nr:alkyl hydroperoxide reductase [Salipaludibacillus keqinensis]